MNSVLREQIRAGDCLVHLDNVLIMSPSAAEQAKHLLLHNSTDSFATFPNVSLGSASSGI
jgi:hypothetical protein